MTHRTATLGIAAAIGLLGAWATLAGAADDAQPGDATTPPLRDVVFARTDQGPLRLDIHMPKADADAPAGHKPALVVWIHGGGWRNGAYNQRVRVDWLTDHGFALASIGYRLSGVAKFPAQLHDCKAALRWLRAHADDYGYDAARIAVVGGSAGGYLATLVGITGDSGDERLEGTVGEQLDESTRVTAIVNYFGPMDFVLRSQNQPEKTEKPGSPVFDLLGKSAREHPDLARWASPVTHVGPGDPPLLVVHGTKDGTVKPDQAEAIVAAYERHGLDVTLRWVDGAGHGDQPIFEGEHRAAVVEFLRRHLDPEPE